MALVLNFPFAGSPRASVRCSVHTVALPVPDTRTSALVAFKLRASIRSLAALVQLQRVSHARQPRLRPAPLRFNVSDLHVRFIGFALLAPESLTMRLSASSRSALIVPVPECVIDFSLGNVRVYVMGGLRVNGGVRTRGANQFLAIDFRHDDRQHVVVSGDARQHWRITGFEYKVARTAESTTSVTSPRLRCWVADLPDPATVSRAVVCGGSRPPATSAKARRKSLPRATNA